MSFKNRLGFSSVEAPSRLKQLSLVTILLNFLTRCDWDDVRVDRATSIIVLCYCKNFSMSNYLAIVCSMRFSIFLHFFLLQQKIMALICGCFDTFIWSFWSLNCKVSLSMSLLPLLLSIDLLFISKDKTLFEPDVSRVVAANSAEFKAQAVSGSIKMWVISHIPS